MLRSDLIKMAEEYQEANGGFLPGGLVFHEKDIEEIMEAFADVLPDNQYEVVKGLVDKDINNIQRVKLMSMGLALSETECKPHMIRQLGNMNRYKTQMGKDTYMPVADITNSMGWLMGVAMHFFDKAGAEKDPVFIDFAKQCANFLEKAGKGHKDWESEGLPKLDEMCTSFSQSDFSHSFFIRFFMCVMDFYWHSMRLVPDDTGISNKTAMKKAMDVSSLIRSMPRNMREEFMDHLATHGMMPEVMEASPEDSI